MSMPDDKHKLYLIDAKNIGIFATWLIVSNLNMSNDRKNCTATNNIEIYIFNLLAIFNVHIRICRINRDL